MSHVIYYNFFYVFLRVYNYLFFFHLLGFAWIYHWFISKLLLEVKISFCSKSIKQPIILLLKDKRPSLGPSILLVQFSLVILWSAVQHLSWILPTVSSWRLSWPLPSVGSSFFWIPCFPLWVYFLILLEHILQDITTRVHNFLKPSRSKNVLILPSHLMAKYSGYSCFYRILKSVASHVVIEKYDAPTSQKVLEFSFSLWWVL